MKSITSPGAPGSQAGSPSARMRWLLAALGVDLAAAALGFVLGMGFAQSAGAGLGMGLVAGFNGALFCTLVADWLMTRLARRRASAQAQAGR